MRGFTFAEILIAILLVAGGVLTILMVLSRDMAAVSRTRADLIAQTALRKRVEERRLQPFATIFTNPTVGNCRNFTDETGYEQLAGLPYGEGRECAFAFEHNSNAPDVRRRYLTITTRAFEQPATWTDPRVRSWQMTMPIYSDGLNRQ